jgi:hypothetical protein
MSDLTHALIEEDQNAPEPARREVFDFLVFLKGRRAVVQDHGRMLARVGESPGPDFPGFHQSSQEGRP